MIGYLSTRVDYKILLSQYDGWVGGLFLKNDNQNVFCWEFLIKKNWSNWENIFVISVIPSIEVV